MSFTHVPLHDDDYTYGLPVWVVVDHASNRVPRGLDLYLSDSELDSHIAWDIGAHELAKQLNYESPVEIFAGDYSRLVVDLNRAVDDPRIVSTVSDGIEVLGNYVADVSDRIARYWQPYHDAIAARIASHPPSLIVSLHSFTPRLRGGEPRPWEIGVLYNNDDRAARVAVPLLEAADVVTGDQQPYSGKVLNATMNRHGEGTGTPYLGLEVRQDLIDSPQGVAKWAAILRPVIDACARAVQADAR